MAADPLHISIVDRNKERHHERADPDEGRLDAMREEVERLAGIVGGIIDRRSRDAARAAESSKVVLRRAIRHQPWTSLAVAGATGALLAIAVTRPSASRSRSRGWRTLDSYMTPDAQSTLGNLRSSLSRDSLATRLEQVADAIANIDPAAATSPIVSAANRVLKALRG